MLIEYIPNVVPETRIKEIESMLEKYEKLSEEYLASEESLPVTITFEQAIEDTIKKWKLINELLKPGHNHVRPYIIDLKRRADWKRIDKLLNAEEPLCFYDEISPVAKSKCHACPLYWINESSCNKSSNPKGSLLSVFEKGHGDFSLISFITLLKRIARKRPLRHIGKIGDSVYV